MTPAEFREQRRSLRLSRSALLDRWRRIAWPGLKMAALDNWGYRGAPAHVALALAYMRQEERLRQTLAACGVRPPPPLGSEPPLPDPVTDLEALFAEDAAAKEAAAKEAPEGPAA